MTARRQLQSGRANRLVRHLVGAFHSLAFVYWVFFANYLGFEDRVLVVGLLIGQCSVLTALATLGYFQSHWGKVTPWCAAGIAWYGISRVLMWSPREELAAGWLIGILMSVLATIAGVRFLEWRCFATDTPSLGKHELITPARFPLRTLIAWTTIAAVLFSIPQLGQRLGQWDATTLGGKTLGLMLSVGVGFAITTTIGIWAVSDRHLVWMIFRLGLAAALTVGVALTIDQISHVFGLDNDPSPASVIRLFGMQAATVALTFRLVGARPELMTAGDRISPPIL